MTCNVCVCARVRTLPESEPEWLVKVQEESRPDGDTKEDPRPIGDIKGESRPKGDAIDASWPDGDSSEPLGATTGFCSAG